MTTRLTLTEDSWRALASSSPWRWRTLHFARSDLKAEAWIRRPGLMVVRRPDGRLFDHSDGQYTQLPRAAGPPRYIGDNTPELRPDGLVTGRPSWPEGVSETGQWIEQDDPLYQGYTWVAMLDPLELAHETNIQDVEEGELRGRRTWWATVSAKDAYEPRCRCCALIWCEAVDRYLSEEEIGRPYVPPTDGYPDGFRVGLDVQTGVIASFAPVGKAKRALRFEVTIHQVDGPADVIDQVRERDRSRVQPRRFAGDAVPGQVRQVRLERSPEVAVDPLWAPRRPTSRN